MKIVRGINFIEGSREEELPNFESNFPYIASRVELNQYEEDSIPWHWHKSVEVFYVEQGNLEYRTPNDKHLLFLVGYKRYDMIYHNQHKFFFLINV